jgi:hypothetical protein
MGSVHGDGSPGTAWPREPVPAATRGPGGRGRDVLVLPAHRARRPAARPDPAHLVRARPGVRPAVTGRPAQRRRAGLRRRLQHAQRRPAGRRCDRARAARHRRLDGRRGQRQDPGRVRGSGRRDGGPARTEARHTRRKAGLPARPRDRLLPCLRRLHGDRAAGPAHRGGHHPGPPPGTERCGARAGRGCAAACDGAARGGTAACDRAAARGPGYLRVSGPSLPALPAGTSPHPEAGSCAVAAHR